MGGQTVILLQPTEGIDTLGNSSNPKSTLELSLSTIVHLVSIPTSATILEEVR